MSVPFCPGYANEPFRSLVQDYPGPDVYPAKDFRTEWGPVFHRGRLDGSARVLVIGQDPAQHEVMARRILIGTAGRRAQGFVHRLGVGTRYVMLNTFLFSVYGQQGGERHIDDPAITDYRNRWIQAVLDASQIDAVIAFGSLADKAWQKWTATPAAAGASPAYRKLTHPTFPEASGGDVADKTKTMLAAYNLALQALWTALGTAGTADATPYGTAFVAADLPVIPQQDFPAGSPAWMGATNEWAERLGNSAAEKRFNIKITAQPAG